MPLLRNFVDNLRSRIAESGISKTDLAEKAKVHRVTIHRILAGKFDPSLEMCEKLAAASGFSPVEKIFEKNAHKGRKSA